MLGISSGLTYPSSIYGSHHIAQFDGDDSYSTADHNDLTLNYAGGNRFAIHIKMRLDSYSSNQGIIGKADEWGVYMHAGRFYFELHDQSSDSNEYILCGIDDVVADGAWCHITASPTSTAPGRILFNGNRKDGSIHGSDSGFVSDENLSNIMTIGKATTSALSTNFTAFMTGDIDTIVMWKFGSATEITEAQMVAFYNGGELLNPLEDSGDYDCSDRVLFYYTFEDLDDQHTSSHDLAIEDGDPTLAII